METIHDGVLLENPPLVQLLVDGKRYDALEARVVSDAPHHRVSQVLFDAIDSTGFPLVTDNSSSFELVAPIDGSVDENNTYHWDLPMPYGLGALNGDQMPAPTSTVLTWPTFIAIMGGMLSALSPCLLQLAVYYTAVLTGTEATAGGKTTQAAKARATLMKTSLFFVGGFTLVYTAGGLFAGLIGQSLENLAGLETWYRPVSLVSGVIIILLAIRVAAQSRVPLVCKLPIRTKATEWLGSSLMGFSFAIGCLSCFSVTVLSALLLYAGSTGSPVTGALLLFIFSVGIGFVFLLAAWGMGKFAGGIMDHLQRAQPILGTISALVMILFGILMATYQFHTVSGFLFGLFYGN